MAATAARETSGRLLNRELSTLEYNARLLDLAGDDSLPLLERVKMCRFVSSNLDEFLMVRVAGLMGQAAAGLAVRSADGLTPRAALALIRERVLELTVRQAKLWKRTLRPALVDEGIVIAQIEDLDPSELAELEERFHREIFPVLTPLGVGPGQPFPYISGLSLSLGVLARDPESGEERFARVKVPEGLPRFFAVGEHGRLLPLETPIAHFLDRLFPGMEILERSVFRVTRDADFEVSDEADDLLEAVELELRRRRFGDVVRVEVSSSTSRGMLERLCQGLGAAPDQVYEIHGPLDLADLDQLTELDRPELKYEPSLGVTPSRLVHAKSPRDLFAEIRRSDFLVHQPYESFAASFEAFVQAAARDPDVIAMKTAVYRTSGDSPLVRGSESLHRRPGDRGGHRLALQLSDRLRASVAVPEDPRRTVRAAHRLVERIRAAGQAAAEGVDARVRFKVNALTDEAVIEELYTASQHGAKIEIVARSICMLKPGVPGMSETISVRSIVGRYLEHSRLYGFQIGDQVEVFFGSADLMTRNLDHRIEVVVPVEQPRLRQELIAIFDSSFADTASSWELAADGIWTRRKRAKDERAHSHQLNLQRRARVRTRRAGGARSR
jgi:polyphosphate kinase